MYRYHCGTIDDVAAQLKLLRLDCCRCGTIAAFAARFGLLQHDYDRHGSADAITARSWHYGTDGVLRHGGRYCGTEVLERHGRYNWGTTDVIGARSCYCGTEAATTARTPPQRHG